MHALNSLGRIRWLYHFTDARNLSSIKEDGGLYSTEKLRERGFDLFHPGGNEVSLEADRRFGMDKYVHLCFTTNHPLEYIARRVGRIRSTAWLAIDPSVLNREGVIFCPGVANKKGIETFPIADAIEMIDFEVLYTRTDWNDPVVYARRQVAEKCEILVPDHVPLKYFERYLPNG